MDKTGEIIKLLLERAPQNDYKLSLGELLNSTQRPDLPVEKEVAEFDLIYVELIKRGVEIIDDTEIFGDTEKENPPEIFLRSEQNNKSPQISFSEDLEVDEAVRMYFQEICTFRF